MEMTGWIGLGLMSMFGFIALLVVIEKWRHVREHRRKFARDWRAAAKALEMTAIEENASRLCWRMEGTYRGTWAVVSTRVVNREDGQGDALDPDHPIETTVRAHFQAPLDMGLKIERKFGSLAGVASMFGLGGGDLETGDADFDRTVVLSAVEEDAALRMLGAREREALTRAFLERVVAVYDFGVQARRDHGALRSADALRPYLDSAVETAQLLERAKARVEADEAQVVEQAQEAAYARA